MAEGFALNVDTNFLNNLDKADKKMKDIIETSQKMSKAIIESFKEANSNGLKTFIENLNGVNKALGSKSKPIVFKDISTQVTQAADKVNSFITLMNKINNVDANKTRNSAVTKINEELEIAKKRLGELQNLLNFYTKGEGQKAIGFVDTTASQKEARALMNQIDLLERQKASLQANARLRMTLAQQQEARDNAWAKMQNDKDRREAESAKRASQYAKQYSEDYRKSYEERYRAYEAMFDKIEGKENRRRSAQDLFNQGTVLYNSVYDKNGYKSVENMRNALSQMQNAQSKLNLNTEQGRKKYAEMDVIIKQVQKDIDKATGAQEQFRNKSSKLVDTMGQLRRSLALLFSVSQITGYMNKLVQVRKEMELQQRSLQVLLQNKDEANKLWQQTVDLAVRSPFRVKELVTYTRQLAAYRIETDKLHDTTKRLADVSAGLGVDMQRLILAFGQVRAANYLRGTELRQFTEAGIPMLDELAKHFSELEGKAISAGDVFEMISKRMVSFADVEAVFRRMTDAGGAFYNMQEEQSKTLAGMISNLHDSIDLMLNDIGQAQDGVLKGTVNAARVFVQNWESMAVAIKGVLIALAGYKLYQLAIKEANIQTAASMGLVNAAATKQLTMAQLLKVGWSNLGKTMATTGATMKSMLAFNLPLLIGGAIITGIAKFVSAWSEHKEQLEDIGKEYDDLRKKIEVINVKFNLATDENDFKEQKNKLNELVTLANNDYHMKIKVDVEGMNAKQIQEKFNEISQQLFDANIFAEHFAKAMQQSTEWVVEDDIFEDLEQLGTKSTELLHELSLNRERIVFDLQKAQNELNESQLKALELLSKPKKIDESEVEYLNRIKEGYSLLIDEYSSYKNALKNTKDAATASKLNVEFSKVQQTFKRLGIDANDIYKTLTKYDEATREAKNEFDLFVKNINLDENLSPEQKEIRLKTAIDKQAAQKSWNDFVKDYVMEWTEEAFGIMFKVVPQEKDPLKAWQETYNEMFRGFEGFKEITQNTEKQTAVIERLNENYKTTKDLIDRINKAGGVSATLSGGAYEGENLNELSTKLEQVQKQIDWFGAETKKEKDKNKEAKILKNRISLVEQLYKEYTKLNEKFSAKESEEQVRKAFGDTFKEAFEGTGINLSGLIVDKERLSELQQAGNDAGQAFSDAMLAKMNDVAERGTYIREFAKDTIDFITSNEGKPILKAKDVEGLGKGYTIGYGEYGEYKDTKKKIQSGDTITQEEAVERFTNIVLPKYRDALNKVLDANNDLIFTQEQYNALLDLTYQGSERAAINLIKYARDEAKGVEHINQIRKKYADTFGEEEAESKFGESFVNKFKEAENVYERMALLLKTMNLTVDGVIRKDLPGMITRSEKRYSLFSGDLDVIEVLRKSAIDVSQIDFTNIEGVIAILKKLVPIAEQEGKEAQLTLSRAISDKEVEIGVKTKVEEDKKLIDQIEDMFSGYEMSIELQKMNIPPDLAKQLFNLDTLSLPELKDKVVSMQSQFVGTDMEEDYRKFLKKISEMEDKEQVERLKKFAKFLTDTADEIAKVRSQGVLDINYAKELFVDGKLTAEQYVQAIKSIIGEVNSEVSKINLDKFKDSPEYIAAMGDMAGYTVKELEKLSQKIQDLISQNANSMSPEEIKAYNDALEKINQRTKELKSPFGKNWIQEIQEIRSLEKDLSSEKAKQSELNQQLEQQTARLLELQQKLAELKSKPQTEETKTEISNTVTEIQETQQGIADTNGQLNTTAGNISNIGGKLQTLLNGMGSSIAIVDKIVKGISQGIQATIQLFNDVKTMMDSFGVDTESGAWQDLSIAMDTLGTMNDKATQGWEDLKSGNIAGAVANTIGVVTSLITGLNQIHDAKYERRIQREIKFVEDLEKAYEKLEKQIDEAYSIDTLQRSGKTAKANLENQIDSYERMIAAEEDKKKTDKERIKEWENTIEDIREQIDELNKELVSTATGGIMDDVLSVAQEFTNAWLEAFNETEDGLSGLEDNFKETMLEMVKQQASMLITQAYVDRWKKELEKYINPDDLNLTTAEAGKWVDTVTSSLPQLNEALENYFTSMKQAGVDLGGEGGELSGLQRGIASASEATMQAVEAYLNSIRWFVAEQNTYLAQIAANFGNTEIENPMVSQLRIIAQQTSAINTLLNSLVKGGHTLGGQGIKVFIS